MPTSVFLFIVIALLVAILAIQLCLLRRRAAIDMAPLQQTLQAIQESCGRAEQTMRQEAAQNREELAAGISRFREEMSTAFKGTTDTLNTQIVHLTQVSHERHESLRSVTEQHLQLIQKESASAARLLREEMNTSLKGSADSLVKTLGELGAGQRQQLGNVVAQLDRMSQASERRLDSLKLAVEQKLRSLQEDNARQLDQMRHTVDEKLQGTLERRLGESFKQVGERLEAVYKGLGEMQALASGVGDLKRVLTNVKTRGTWGEVQLGAMLEQVLNPDQYAANVAPRGDGERVEFAIKLPGRGDATDDVVWLPIDAKFPMEDYGRLVEAQETADAELAEQAAKQLEARIRSCARDICTKYLNPPATTDFGILFLPTEGLFAEVIRRIGLTEYVQRECRVVIAGPSNLWSILNSLQMGFRTLAIEKRSSEVWNLLAAVKTEWSRYGAILGKVQKKLQEASNTIEAAEVRTRAIGRKLRSVQELPAADARQMLMLPSSDDGQEVGEDGI